MKRLCLILTLLLSIVSVCVAATNEYVSKWPDFQNKITPGPSNSSLKATLPEKLHIIKPSGDIPSEIAMFSGIWQGSTGKNKTGDNKLAVLEIKKEGEKYIASLIYAFASEKAQISPVQLELNGEFVNNELQAKLLNGTEMIFYRLRADGNLDTKWVKVNGKGWVVGVMTKVQ